MKIISLGLQCSVPQGIKSAELRSASYPFDWLWTPGRTTYQIMKRLLEEGVSSAVEYMTTGYSYYTYMDNEHYISASTVTECQINKETGLGNTHFPINDEYKSTLARRLERLRTDIYSSEYLLFLYADAANSYCNYNLDGVDYGHDATEDLSKIYDLLSEIHPNMKIIYFCWDSRMKTHTKIEHIPFTPMGHWVYIADLIRNYLIRLPPVS